MAGGNAIRGSRVGAGPMGEAERGESAPRQRVGFWCANGHESRPSFAADAPIPDLWDCPPLTLYSQSPARKSSAGQVLYRHLDPDRGSRAHTVIRAPNATHRRPPGSQGALRTGNGTEPENDPAAAAG